MKNITRHTGLLQVVERLPSSTNGNPRYLVVFDGYTCRTKIDCSIGYMIDNLDDKTCTGTIGTHYGSVHIDTITPVLHSMITLTNDFHNTSIRLRAKFDDYLSTGQVKRAARTLCPVSDCYCGQTAANIRGRQNGFDLLQIGMGIFVQRRIN